MTTENVFRKWISIENHYQEKWLSCWLKNYPELNGEVFQITEKLHGANFSIIVHNENVHFASRNNIIEPDNNFYGFREVFKSANMTKLIDFLKKISKDKTYQLVGELYGGKIQKGVWYGKEKSFRWFGLYINGELVSPKDTDNLLFSFQYLKVPVIRTDKVDDLSFLVSNFKTDFNSLLTPENFEDENICEGVAIVPYNKVYRNQDSYFYIKKKNEKFKETQRSKKVRAEKELSSDIKDIITDLSSYICGPRLEGLFSKFGRFEEKSKLGFYASKYFEDIIQDFEKDSGDAFSKLEKEQQKIVSKAISKHIFADLLKEV